MPHVAARTASRDRDTGRYQSHRPEQTLLYQIVDEYYPAFAALMAEQGKELPGYVQREFEEFLQCGRLEHGFLRVRCESCHAEHLVAFSCKRRGFCPSCGARRMAESAALLVVGKGAASGKEEGKFSALLAPRQPDWVASQGCRKSQLRSKAVGLG